jgi:hypothetical protein
MSAIDRRLTKLEEIAPQRSNLDALSASELEALAEALAEQDAVLRGTKIAAIDLRPESELAVTRFINELQEGPR